MKTIGRLARLAVFVVAIAGLTSTLPGAVPCCALSYDVRPDPWSGSVQVDLRIHGFKGDSLILARPSQRPLTGLLGQDPIVSGAAGPRWSLIDGAPRWAYARPLEGWPDVVRVDYKLDITAERPLNAWSVGLDHDLLYAPAEAIFLVPAMPDMAAQHAPVRVRWDLPWGWSTFTGWDSDRFLGLRTLMKTNILAGRIDRYDERACGVTVHLGVHGRWDFEPADLARDLSRLACAARYRLGDPTVDEFSVSLVSARFPLTSGNRNGPHAIGLVHTVPDGSRPGTRLLAHEMVHQWQRFDAAPWFQEGVNDFMALRLALEAHLLSPREYRRTLAAIDATYRSHPQRDRWSFDDEQRKARPYGPSDSYLAYRKGAIVGLALDRELRLRTGGRVDLGRLWREMNTRAGWGHVAWDDEDIEALAGSLMDGDFEHFFAAFVNGTETLPRAYRLRQNLPPLGTPPSPGRGFATLAAFVQTTLGQLAPSVGTSR